MFGCICVSVSVSVSVSMSLCICAFACVCFCEYSVPIRMIQANRWECHYMASRPPLLQCCCSLPLSPPLALPRLSCPSPMYAPVNHARKFCVFLVVCPLVTFLCVFVNMPVYLHIRAKIYTVSHMHTQWTQTQIYAQRSTCRHTHMHTFVRSYICVCVCACGCGCK